jgi:hypothetical protein
MAFDKDKFAAYLASHAGKNSQHHCAKFVRLALEAGGADTSGHPITAKEYGPTLLKNGFHVLEVTDPAKFRFAKGDVVVMGPTKQGNPAGHIAGFDGEKWISDFVQSDFWPGSAYKKEKPSYVVYRR